LIIDPSTKTALFKTKSDKTEAINHFKDLFTKYKIDDEYSPNLSLSNSSKIFNYERKRD